MCNVLAGGSWYSALIEIGIGDPSPPPFQERERERELLILPFNMKRLPAREENKVL